MTSRCMLRALLLLLATGCGAQQRAPLMQIPLLTQRGQGEAGLTVRPASPRSEIGGTVRVAATDHLRLGASVGGGTRRRDEQLYDGERMRLSSSLLAEGFVGLEWGRFFRYGALLGSGYGASRYAARSCVASAVGPGCTPRGVAERSFRYVRSYGQVHVALAPPGPFALALAVRIPFVVDLSREGVSPESDTSPELGLQHSLLLRHVRVDLQPMWSRAQGFSFHLALLLRFQPPRR